MKRSLGALVVLASFGAAPLAHAADHRDGPAAKSAPESDITDVYAWMSTDKSQTYLIMNVSPAATTSSKFSDKVQYVFHLNSTDKYGETDTSKIKSTTILCTFDTSQAISCWLGPSTTTGLGTPIDYVTGDASKTTGLTSQNGKMKVFAGLRDDPFFFNLDGFTQTVKDVEMAAAQPGFSSIVDANGCPHLPSATAAMLAGQLGKAADSTAAKDAFAGLNVLSIVLSVDTTSVTPGGKVLGVWASTNKKP